MAGEIDRRGFLLGGAALAAMRGLCAGGPKLRLGVLSDIHISSGGVNGPLTGDTRMLERALTYFRERGADAVVIAGDLADWGLVDELEQVAATWRKVFPGDRAPDGRRVERLFVYGNHDLGGWDYGYREEYSRPEAEFAPEKRIMREWGSYEPCGEVWERVFGEKWSPLTIREVKGYKFVLCQVLQYPKEGPDADFLERHRAELAGPEPFFYVQHYHPRDTTCAPWTFGQDSGASTRALAAFPNAVAFSGHSHTPLVDDRVVWQGSFTSIGTASLRYVLPLGGRENAAVFAAADPKTQQMDELDGSVTQQGEFVTVYGDCLVVERRDFASGRSLGPDWVVPLGPDGSMSFERRAAQAAVPQFADGAEVRVTEGRGRNRGGVEMDQVTVSFPAATAGARAFDYEVTVEAVDVDVEKPWLVKRVYPPDFLRPRGKEPSAATCVFARAELPPPYMRAWGDKTKPLTGQAVMRYRFAVRPCNCWGRKGEPIRSRWFGEDR